MNTTITVYRRVWVGHMVRRVFDQSTLTGRYKEYKDGDICVEVQHKNSWITYLFTREKYWYEFVNEDDFRYTISTIYNCRG